MTTERKALWSWQLVLSWAIVSAPLAWGVSQTILKSLPLFYTTAN